MTQPSRRHGLWAAMAVTAVAGLSAVTIAMPNAALADPEPPPPPPTTAAPADPAAPPAAPADAPAPADPAEPGAVRTLVGSPPSYLFYFDQPHLTLGGRQRGQIG
ncbi:MAG: alanine and proline-rich secreted protein Apa, partial [Actinomycetia bacterium]|nr:alanine and proline-rich secreted protein Apa [Actinomycetes bacterium]